MVGGVRFFGRCSVKYRKKPIVIEARQFNIPCGTVAEWCGGKAILDGGTCVLRIETLEGAMNASVGDYIIKGVKGEFYPCKPDIFEATYEPFLRKD